jgi:hypothetical protein
MKAHIKIAFRQIIDVNCNSQFEKNVLRASFNEFVLKSQAYNLENRFRTFQEMVENDGRANSLHYKSGFAITNFIKALNNKMPVLQDSLARPIHFITHKFEIIDSDLSDASVHKVAVTYMTDTLTLFGSMGDYLLLGVGIQNPVDTFVLKMRDGLSIFNYVECGAENATVQLIGDVDQSKF